MPAALSKAGLRVQMAKRVSSLDVSTRRELDASIQQRIRDLAEFKAARQVLAYLPLPDEPDLVLLLSDAAASGKRVYIPVAAHCGDLSFLRWTPADQTRALPLGRWSPSSTEQPGDDVSIVLVPGRAFDHRGARLGRGRGCYDKSLDTLSSSSTVVGVAYETQIVDAVPCEAHDRSVAIVVTERRTLRPAAVRGDGDLP